MQLLIIGGYLGTGKTTWLRHQLFAGAIGETRLIVNEAAGTPVDDALLGGVWKTLAGGCACCTGQGTLIAALRELADMQVRGDTTLCAVLETSGLADPAAIIDAVQGDPVLAYHFRFDPVHVLVDAVYGLEQLRREPLARRQIEAADRLVITKVDAADHQNVANLVSVLRGLNPQAELCFANKGEAVDLPDLPPAQMAGFDFADAPSEAPVPVRLDVPHGTDWTALSVWLSALLHARGDRIVRMKGVVRTPAGRLLLQAVRQTVQQPEVLPEDSPAEDDAIIFIGRDLDETKLRRSFETYVG